MAHRVARPVVGVQPGSTRPAPGRSRTALPRLWTATTSIHSACTASSPRRLEPRNPRASLMLAEDGRPAERAPWRRASVGAARLGRAASREIHPASAAIVRAGQRGVDATAITITRLAVAGRTVAGGRADRWHCLGSR